MSDNEKITKLRAILEPILVWYRQVEEQGEPDSSYLYDTTYEKFNDLSHGDFQQIVEILK